MGRCTSCLQDKADEEFNWSNQSEGRRQGRCRACCRSYNAARYQTQRAETIARARAYFTEHREEVRVRSATYYKKNADEIKERVKADRLANPAKIKARKSAYYVAHADEIKAKDAVRRRTNREQYNAAARERYAQNKEPNYLGSQVRYKRTHHPGHEQFSRKEIWDRDGGICHLCGEAARYADSVRDHIVPLALGGPHTRANVKIAHRWCNAIKGPNGASAARARGRAPLPSKNEA